MTIKNIIKFNSFTYEGNYLRMKEGDINLDLCRVLAIFSIMFNHALNSVYNVTDYSYWLNSIVFEKAFSLIGYSFSRLGVPLFLMITGALILKKDFNNFEKILQFYKKNLTRLIISVCLWNIIYYLLYIALSTTF